MTKKVNLIACEMAKCYNPSIRGEYLVRKIKMEVDYQDLSVQTTKTNGRISEKSWTDANGYVKQETASASGSVTTTSDLGDGSESITTKYTYDDRGNTRTQVP